MTNFNVDQYATVTPEELIAKAERVKDRLKVSQSRLLTDLLVIGFNTGYLVASSQRYDGMPVEEGSSRRTNYEGRMSWIIEDQCFAPEQEEFAYELAGHAYNEGVKKGVVRSRILLTEPPHFKKITNALRGH
jgi:hypothetical protein